MKKRILALLVLVLSLFCLVACSNDSGSGDKENGTKVKKTVIKYCNWNFGTEEDYNLTRRRVDAFNKSSSTIRIELVEQLEGTGYDDFLATLASAGDLPDVFMVNSVPTAVINEWALDITDLTSNDSEWENIPEALRESITYNGHVYAVPAGQYYMGLFANLDLIDEYMEGSVTASEKFAPGNFTTQEWIDMVKKMRYVTPQDGTGIIGMNAVGDMLNWLPSTLDETGTIKHFVWNGEKFDFTSDLLIDAMRIITELGDPASQYVFDAIPATEGEGDDLVEIRSAIFGPGSASDVFKNGQMGFIQEGSWAGTYEDTDFECVFTSYPDGKVVASTDFMCISKSTLNKEAAYEVAKYMTFGEKGCEDMFKILDENLDNPNVTLTCMPLNTDDEISAKWLSYIKMKGLNETFQAVKDGKVEVVVEGNKTVPGFLKARYTFNTGLSFENDRGGALLTIGDFLWDVCDGKISINDYIANMTEALSNRINEEVKNDMEKIGGK